MRTGGACVGRSPPSSATQPERTARLRRLTESGTSGLLSAGAFAAQQAHIAAMPLVLALYFAACLLAMAVVAVRVYEIRSRCTPDQIHAEAMAAQARRHPNPDDATRQLMLDGVLSRSKLSGGQSMNLLTTRTSRAGRQTRPATMTSRANPRRTAHARLTSRGAGGPTRDRGHVVAAPADLGGATVLKHFVDRRLPGRPVPRPDRMRAAVPPACPGTRCRAVGTAAGGCHRRGV
jgi:hypothetical protein